MGYFLYQGQISPSLLYTVTTGSGTVSDLTGKTVTLSYRLAGSDVLIVDHRAVTIFGAPTDGVIQFDPAAGDTDIAGTMLAFLTITPTAGLPEDTPEFSFSIYTHTVPWCSAGDVARASGISTPIDGGDLLDAAVMASELLFELSGRLFSVHRETVRPCRSTCGCWTGGSFANGIPPGLLSWGAWGLATGFWGWGWDGCDDQIGCDPLPTLELSGAPVQEINQVKVDGNVLSPTLYRLDEYDELVRTDGVWWPSCQNMALPDTAAGTWSVDYTWGAPPPTIGARAAAQLAAELYASLAGGKCSLPLAATMITRQGVRIDRTLAGAFAKAAKDGGGFGLTLVDAFLATYNPEGLTEQPSVWSPDVQREPRRVDTGWTQ